MDRIPLWTELMDQLFVNPSLEVSLIQNLFKTLIDIKRSLIVISTEEENSQIDSKNMLDCKNF